MTYNIVVTGSASGLGAELVQMLLDDGHRVIGIDVAHRDTRSERCPLFEADVSEEDQVKRVLARIGGPAAKIDGVINCAGINHIDWLKDMTVEAWDKVMNTNARGIFVTSAVFLPALVWSKGFICNIVSNAAHIPMTCSLAYNASKAAAHIMTLQLARELSPQGITVFGIAPNKMKGTEMSRYIERTVPGVRGWTPEYAEEYQRKSLLCGEETPPYRVAEFITFLLAFKERHKYLTGCILPYGA